MARLSLVDPKSADEPTAELLARIGAERGGVFNVYRMLANSPGTLEHLFALTSYLWHRGALPPRLQEIVILRVAQLTDSHYEWARHRNVARRVGVPDGQVDALANWREAPELFDDVERAALTLTEEATLDIEASAVAVAAVRELLGEQATLELVVLTGLYGMLSRVLRSLAVDPEAGDAPIPRGPARADGWAG
jgi:4-carboxymuconolactone decarboxylase